ncbi:MAG TPA: hypothetical protein ENN43_07260 [bacterium]|nr:hypothetical protein [bacterium]
MNTENYRDVFLEEAEENVRNINFSLLELEKTPSDLGHVNELFRAAHTLKGMSATMGYDKLAGFTHVLEDLLDRVRSGVLRAGQDVINMLFKSADIITGFIENIKERNLDFSDGHGEATEAIKRIIDKGSAAGGSMAESFETGPEEKAGEESGAPGIEVEEFLLQEAQARELKVFLIRVYLVKTCAFKNVRAFMATRNLSEKGEIIKSNPAAKEIEEGDFGSFFELAFVTKEEKDAVVSSISRIAEIDRIEIKELKSAGMEEKKAEEEGKGAAARETGSGKKSQVSQSVRVNLEKIDSMMNLVGELVITKIRLGQITKEKNYEKLRDTVEEFDRIIDSLQMEVTDVRMLPVAHIFDRYPRLVRDIAAQAGKQVELEVFGSDIEIDRTVLEEINEPVMHLLRNSIAHGIEDLAQREIKGKSKKGVIRLGARRERNSVIIEVSDDGSGINIEKVKKKAVEKGLLTPERSKAKR